MTPANRDTLRRCGWVVKANKAKIAYCPGVTAVINTSGEWKVTSKSRTLSGKSDWDGKPHIVAAAMDANEAAWNTPEYRAWSREPIT